MSNPKNDEQAAKSLAQLPGAPTTLKTSNSGELNLIPPESCTCGALYTVRGKHGKKDCPYLPSQVDKIINDWIHDEKAQIGPKRILVGNNFDMLSQRIEEYVREAEKRGWDNLAKQIEDDIAEFGDQVPLIFTIIEQTIHGDGERENVRYS